MYFIQLHHLSYLWNIQMSLKKFSISLIGKSKDSHFVSFSTWVAPVSLYIDELSINNG